MRRIMQEGDLIVAEVHSVNADKSYNLHTRNPKYGRLEPGVLVEVGHRQVKRQKHHMIALGRVGLILGNNGNLYLSNFKRNEVSNLKDIASPPNYLPADYQAIAVVANILRVLATEGLEISEILVKELGELVAQKGLETASLLKEESELREELLNRVRERIPKRIEEISSSLRKN
jgi:exosome complex component RRP4